MASRGPCSHHYPSLFPPPWLTKPSTLHLPLYCSSFPLSLSHLALVEENFNPPPSLPLFLLLLSLLPLLTPLPLRPSTAPYTVLPPPFSFSPCPSWRLLQLSTFPYTVPHSPFPFSPHPGRRRLQPSTFPYTVPPPPYPLFTPP